MGAAFRSQKVNDWCDSIRSRIIAARASFVGGVEYVAPLRNSL